MQSAISKFDISCICCLLKAGGDSCQEIPLSQLPPCAALSGDTSTMKTLTCPGAPEYKTQTGDSVRRLASKVSFHFLRDVQCVRASNLGVRLLCRALRRLRAVLGQGQH